MDNLNSIYKEPSMANPIQIDNLDSVYKDLIISSLAYMEKVELTEEARMLLTKVWLKNLHDLNEDDLENCSLELLNELCKLPQIPASIGNKLHETYLRYAVSCAQFKGAING